MKIRFILFVLLLGLWPERAGAQTLQISGRVIDTAGEALAFANFAVETVPPASAPRYFIADGQGRFLLRLPAGQTYRIRVSYLGYKTSVFEVDSSARGKLYRQVVLEPLPENLAAVEFRIRHPVRVKEDSVIYVADSFRTGTEWKLADLVKKMPGMEITPQGQIRVMGKEVSQVLVEDKPFFGGNPRMALENIPAEAVDEIQAIDDYNSISFMRQVDDRQRMGLNIKLKKDKKRFFFGDVSAAAGTEQKASFHPRIYYYSPGGQGGFIGFAGNTGEMPLSSEDLLRMSTGSMSSRAREAIRTYKQLSSLFQGDFYRLTARMGSFQWHYDRGKNNLSLLGLAYGREGASRNIRRLWRQTVDYEEITDRQSAARMQAGLANVHWRRKNNVWDYVEINHSSLWNNQAAAHLVTGMAGSMPLDLTEQKQSFDYRSLTEAVWYKKWSRKWIVRLRGRWTIDRQRNGDDIRAVYPLFAGVIPWPADSLYRLQDTVRNNFVGLEGEVKLYFLATGKWHFYWTGGYMQNQALFGTGAHYAVNGDAWQSLTPYGFGDTLAGNYSVWRQVAQIKYASHGLLARAGWEWRHYRYPFSAYSMTFPFMQWRYKMKHGKVINLRLEGVPEEVEWQYFSDGYYWEDSYRLQKGRPGLAPPLTYRAHITWRDFDLSRPYEWYAGLSYDYTKHPLIPALSYNGPSLTVEMMQGDTPVRKWRGYASAKYYFGAWYVMGRYRHLTTLTYRFFNGQSSDINRQTDEWYGRLGLIRHRKIEAYAGLALQTGCQQTGDIIDKGRMWKADFQWIWAFASRWNLRLDYRWKHQDDRPPIHAGQLRVTYRPPGDKWRFYLEGHNLWGQSDIYFYFDDDRYIEEQIFRMPAFWLLGATRKF